MWVRNWKSSWRSGAFALPEGISEPSQLHNLAGDREDGEALDERLLGFPLEVVWSI